MYEVIKKADEFGLNKVFADSREFVQVIDELSAQKDTIEISFFEMIYLWPVHTGTRKKGCTYVRACL